MKGKGSDHGVWSVKGGADDWESDCFLELSSMVDEKIDAYV